MLAIAREVLAQAPVHPEAFDGFDPGDLEGSLARLVAFNRGSARSHMPLLAAASLIEQALAFERPPSIATM
jgi:hypothetical protein